MKHEDFVEIVKGKGIDDLLEEIKKLKGYAVYINALKSGADDSNRILASIVLLEVLVDDKLRVLVNSVSLDLLFSIIDAKLRNEILNENSENQKSECES